MLMNNLDPEVAERPEELVVYGGIGRAARDWASYRRDRRLAQGAGARRDAARAVGQAGRRLPHDAGRAARAARQLEPRAGLGDLGPLPRARPQGPDDVRPDDGGLVDLYRLAGHRAGHLRDLRRGGPPALWRRSGGALDPDRRARRHGRRAAARRDHGGRVPPRRRVPDEPHREAPADRLSRRLEREPRRGARRCSRRRRRDRGGRSRSASSAMRPRSSRRSCAGSRRATARPRPDMVTDQTSAHDPLNGYLPAGWTLEEHERAQARGSEGRRERPPKSLDGGAGARHAGAPPHGHPDARLRQQHPPDGQGDGRRRRLRLPGLRAGLYPPAVLPGHRAVPLGGAVGRPRGHLPHGRSA